MTERLLSRLDELAAVAAGVRAKIQGQNAGQLDGLAVARLLVAVDAAASKLNKLNDALQPALFPTVDGNGQGDAGRAPAGRKRK